MNRRAFLQATTAIGCSVIPSFADACAVSWTHYKLVDPVHWDRRIRKLFLREEYGLTDINIVELDWYKAKYLKADNELFTFATTEGMHAPIDGKIYVWPGPTANLRILLANHTLFPNPPFRIDTYIERLDEKLTTVERFQICKYSISSNSTMELMTRVHPFGAQFALVIVCVDLGKKTHQQATWAVASPPIYVDYSHCGSIAPVTPEQYYGSFREQYDKYLGHDPY